MARKLSVEDVAAFRRGKQPQVDWRRCDTGDGWALYRGEDFQCSARAAVNSARSWAARHDRTVRARVLNDNEIWVYFQPVEEQPAPAVDEGLGEVPVEERSEQESA